MFQKSVPKLATAPVPRAGSVDFKDYFVVPKSKSIPPTVSSAPVPRTASIPVPTPAPTAIPIGHDVGFNKDDSDSTDTAVSNGDSNCTTKCDSINRTVRDPIKLGSGPDETIMVFPIPRAMNVYSKVVLFNAQTCKTAGIQPFSAYKADDLNVPMGWAGGSTLYYPLWGGTAASGNSRDFSLLLTNIPLASTELNSIYLRTGSAIFIKRVHAKFTITRLPMADTVVSGATSTTPLGGRYPIVTTYIRHEPVPFQATQTDAGSSTGTAIAYGFTNPPAFSSTLADFIAYGKVSPTINNSGVIAFSADFNANIPDAHIHRNPNMSGQTLVHDLKHFRHDDKYNGVYGATVAAFGTNESVAAPWDGDRMISKRQTTEVVVQKHWPGKGLEVIYDPTSSLGTVAVCNPMYLKYHQDCTGFMFEGTNTAGVVGAMTGASFVTGYNEMIGLECFVEFEDCPTEL